MTCTHENVETLHVHDEYVSYAAWSRAIATVRCLACNEEMRVDMRVGRIKHLKLVFEREDQKKCLHLPFTVNRRTIAIQREMERDSNIARVVLTDDVKYRRFWLAEATCDACEFKFYVKSFFEETLDGTTLTMHRKTPWRQLKRRFGEDLMMKCVPVAIAE